MGEWTEEEEKEKETYREYMRKAKKPDGRCPGAGKFRTDFGVSPGRVARLFPGGHNGLIKEVGGIPNQPKRKTLEEKEFRGYAKICREEKEIAGQPRIKYWTRRLHTPTSGIAKCGDLPGFRARFREWCLANSPEYDDILAMPGWERESLGGKKRVTPVVCQTPSVPYLWLPASLTDLNVLALDRLSPGHPGGVLPSLLFEQRCADAFQSLGFQVRDLGQGTGRNADFLAKAGPGRFAVIVDAKAREGGFVLTTAEERKLVEYARKHTSELRREGYDRVYLCVVSSSFREKDVVALRRALTGTGIYGWSLWTADDLMATVDESIAKRAEFSLADLESRFCCNKMV